MKPTYGNGVVRIGRSPEVVHAICAACGVFGPGQPGASAARDAAVKDGWTMESIRRTGKTGTLLRFVLRCPGPTCRASTPLASPRT